MEAEMIIKNKKGEKVPLLVQESEDHIILSKKNDKSSWDQKRTIKVFVIDSEKLQEFKSIKIEEEKTFFESFLFSLSKNFKKFSILKEEMP